MKKYGERAASCGSVGHIEGEDVMPLGRLTVSVGVAAIPDHASSKEELVERADQALYAAKAASRNCVVVAEEKSVN